MTLVERTVNGRPGLVAERDGRLFAVYAFGVVGARIGRIWVVTNPEKLRSWPARAE
jgi:RNA polymerase sigma-70 factor (ECF subfamily)